MIALVTRLTIKRNTYCGSTGFVRCEVWGSFGSDFVNIYIYIDVRSTAADPEDQSFLAFHDVVTKIVVHRLYIIGSLVSLLANASHTCSDNSRSSSCQQSSVDAYFKEPATAFFRAEMGVPI